MACPLFEKENVRAVLSYRRKIIAKAQMLFFYVPTSKFSSFKMLCINFFVIWYKDTMIQDV